MFPPGVCSTLHMGVTSPRGNTFHRGETEAGEVTRQNWQPEPAPGSRTRARSHSLHQTIHQIKFLFSLRFLEAEISVATSVAHSHLVYSVNVKPLPGKVHELQVGNPHFQPWNCPARAMDADDPGPEVCLLGETLLLGPAGGTWLVSSIRQVHLQLIRDPPSEIPCPSAQVPFSTQMGIRCPGEARPGWRPGCLVSDAPSPGPPGHCGVEECAVALLPRQ